MYIMYCMYCFSTLWRLIKYIIFSQKHQPTSETHHTHDGYNLIYIYVCWIVPVARGLFHIYPNAEGVYVENTVAKGSIQHSCYKLLVLNT